MFRLSVLLCACALAASLPTPTDKTMVVARDENTDVTTASSTVVTTEGPLEPIKISEMEVKSEIKLRYSHTSVVTRVKNPAKKAQEATFRVLLPNQAFISGFVMTLDGKAYKAYVKEKEEAKVIYSQAVSQGLSAAHVATKARDSNHFTVTVNVEPQTEAVFNLTYEELLERRNGVYNHAINLHPGTLVPKLTVIVHVKESSKLTSLRVPEIRTGNEIDATEEDAQNPNAKIEKSEDQTEATITFTPDLEEQKKLMEVYAEKSREHKKNSKSSWYQEEDEEPLPVEGTLGQFVVQYDIDRPSEGEILVNDGYFVHFFAPSSLPPLNKHVIFVLDTSGSMMDRKIEQLRVAMKSILDELHPGDYFNIVEFSSDVTVHDLKEAEKNETKKTYSYYYDGGDSKPISLIPPSDATKENIEKAKIIVNRMDADGGTNIFLALSTAIDIAHKGIGLNNKKPATENNAAAENKPAAEEKPAAEDKPATEVKSDAETKPKESTPQLEPIIIFLTDGEPTVGISDTNNIIKQVSEKNYGDKRASIFSLAFGEDADRKFLRKLSLRSEGFMRHIYEAADAALQLRSFYKQVSSPLLSDVKFVYPADQVDQTSLTKHNFHTYYRGSEVVVAGRLATDKQLTPEVLAFCGVDDSYTRKKYRVVPKLPTDRKAGEYLPLERLWVYLTIQQLLDQKDAADTDNENKQTPEKQALALALKYEFVTPLTSLIVVKPNATSAVDAESVDKPQTTFPSALSAPSYAYAGGAPRPVLADLLPPAAEEFARKFRSRTKSRPTGNLMRNEYPIPDKHHALLLEESDVEDFGDIRLGPAPPPLPVSAPVAAYSGGFSGGYRTSAFSSRVPVSAMSYGERSSFSGTSKGSSYSYLPARPSSGAYFPARPPSGAYSSYPALPSPGVYGILDLHDYDVDLDESTTVSYPLIKYGLAEFSWVQILLKDHEDSLVVSNNGTTKELKLSTDPTTEPKEEGASCDKAVGGGSGVCTYLPRCQQARTITVEDYKNLYCDINGFAGVCCPKKEEPVKAS